ncbi:MAG: aminoacetone oxidase family FAD-binding enzyme [Bacteroidales bacterium]|nr:aminoacetone oxidase family FAD-binding enzyme [Bacteroidales bacterium]
MKYDVIVIGGGASGLMAAYSAARRATDDGKSLRVCVLEKMPRPARKVMITGKGRCNFTNVKDWGSFSAHIRAGAQFVRPAWRNFPPDRVVGFFESAGMPAVIERGDRAYPASYRASDVVDTLVRECLGVGVKIETEAEVAEISRQARNDSGISRNDSGISRNDSGISRNDSKNARNDSGISRNDSKDARNDNDNVIPTEAQRSGGISGFTVRLADGTDHVCSKLIIATGGLSYPATGSTGDGFSWARALGHTVTPLFPSLTALVPKGYKDGAGAALKHHIDRATPMTEFGQKLCGVSLKNVNVTLLVQGTPVQEEFGDIDFTDGGIEGPTGFQLSRKAVKALVNGSKAAVVLDLKPGVSLTELTVRVKELWSEIDRDPRSQRLREKERCRILLGKLMPWELIPAFTAAHPEIITLERRGRADTKVWVNLVSIAKALKEWKFDIEGYVGWERAVITAGGISTDEVVPKTLESRLVPGLHFCGEALDIDADTGGYNLQLAFCTGWLAGQNAAGC